MFHVCECVVTDALAHQIQHSASEAVTFQSEKWLLYVLGSRVVWLQLDAVSPVVSCPEHLDQCSLSSLDWCLFSLQLTFVLRLFGLLGIGQKTKKLIIHTLSVLLFFVCVGLKGLQNFPTSGCSDHTSVSLQFLSPVVSGTLRYDHADYPQMWTFCQSGGSDPLAASGSVVLQQIYVILWGFTDSHSQTTRRLI